MRKKYGEKRAGLFFTTPGNANEIYFGEARGDSVL